MLRNITKNTILSESPAFQNSFNKVRGMLANSAECIVFKTRFGIHTFFMHKNLDILILDNKNRVVARKINLKPFKFFFWNPKYDTVVELNSGIIEKTKTEIGDIISFSS